MLREKLFNYKEVHHEEILDQSIQQKDVTKINVYAPTLRYPGIQNKH